MWRRVGRFSRAPRLKNAHAPEARIDCFVAVRIRHMRALQKSLRSFWRRQFLCPITSQKRLSADPDAALYEAAQCLVHTSPLV
jgi:hypothetical protein